MHPCQTFHGFLSNNDDALIMFEAVHRKAVPRITFRLQDQELSQIRSGTIFGWHEREANIQRWTDGRRWSNSRMKGHFFIYKRLTRSFKELPSTASSSSVRMATQTADGRSQEEGAKPLLRKKTISVVNTDGDKYHLVNYYHEDDAKSGVLPRPSLCEQFADLTIKPGFYFTGLELTPLMLSYKIQPKPAPTPTSKSSTAPEAVPKKRRASGAGDATANPTVSSKSNSGPLLRPVSGRQPSPVVAQIDNQPAHNHPGIKRIRLMDPPPPTYAYQPKQPQPSYGRYPYAPPPPPKYHLSMPTAPSHHTYTLPAAAEYSPHPTTWTDKHMPSTPTSRTAQRILWVGRLSKVQAATGMLLAPFSIAHLFGHVLGNYPDLSVANGYLLVVREVYQHLETIGALVGIVHLAAGAGKYLVYKVSPALPWDNKQLAWHRIAGRLLGAFIWGHAWFTRVGPLMAWGDSSLMDYSYVTFTIHEYGVLFTVYYITLGCAGVLHTLLGIRFSLARLMPASRVSDQSAIAHAEDSDNKQVKAARTSAAARWARRYRIAGWIGCGLVTSSVLALSEYYWRIGIPFEREYERMSAIATNALLGRGMGGGK
ncbi:Global transcription regulator sge1 [Sorochytrium milnesiophthora]